MGTPPIVPVLVAGLFALACSKGTPSDPIIPDGDEPEAPLVHIQGVVLDGTTVAAGVTVEVWATYPTSLFSSEWRRTGRRAVTDVNGVYRFSLDTLGARSACEVVGLVRREGWIVGTTKQWTRPTGDDGGHPPASQSLISAGQCGARNVTGPSLTRIPCDGRTLYGNTFSDCPELTVDLVSPPDGAVFSHVPRATVLVWRSVPGARIYWYDWASPNPGCTDAHLCAWFAGESNATTDTTATFVFNGAQPGRWSVHAIVNGFHGQTSYRYFYYVE